MADNNAVTPAAFQQNARQDNNAQPRQGDGQQGGEIRETAIIAGDMAVRASVSSVRAMRTASSVRAAKRAEKAARPPRKRQRAVKADLSASRARGARSRSTALHPRVSSSAKSVSVS